MDAVRLLESLGIRVEFPADQTCCGQPAFNAGFHDQARQMARHTLQVFSGKQPVILPSGSCSTMLKAHYAELFSGPELEGAWDLAARSFELSQFLCEVLGCPRLGDGLRGKRVAYHPGCHGLRELGIGDGPKRLLEAAGATVVPWEAELECCGFGGLFAVKLPEVSVGMADRKLDTLPEVDVLTSGDPGCLLQLAGRLRVRGNPLPVRHLASLLWEARSGRRDSDVR